MLTLLTGIGTGVSGKNIRIVEGYKEIFNRTRPGGLTFYTMSVPVEEKGFIKDQ
jgi:hypothetical protein